MKPFWKTLEIKMILLELDILFDYHIAPLTSLFLWTRAIYPVLLLGLFLGLYELRYHVRR